VTGIRERNARADAAVRRDREAWGIALTRGAIGGGLPAVPAVFAAFGWGAGWNAYTNLLLTLGALVLWATVALACRSAQTKSALSKHEGAGGGVSERTR